MEVRLSFVDRADRSRSERGRARLWRASGTSSAGPTRADQREGAFSGGREPSARDCPPRPRAEVALEAARNLIKPNQQLRDKTDVEMRESERALDKNQRAEARRTEDRRSPRFPATSQHPPVTRTILPIFLQLRDRLADEEGVWKVVNPTMEHAGRQVGPRDRAATWRPEHEAREELGRARAPHNRQS
jgi:hypothetical protein